MWEHYKKTLTGMQAMIAFVTLAILIWSHRLYMAGAFFGAMQLGALFGAMWGTRLKRLARFGIGTSTTSKLE